MAVEENLLKYGPRMLKACLILDSCMEKFKILLELVLFSPGLPKEPFTSDEQFGCKVRLIALEKLKTSMMTSPGLLLSIANPRIGLEMKRVFPSISDDSKANHLTQAELQVKQPKR